MAKKEIVKAEVVSVRRAQKVYGRDCSQHFVLTLGVKNPETGAVHYADLPLIFTAGLDWAFYDRDSKMSVARKLTAKDTADAIAHARKVFPDWAAYVDALPEDAAPSEAFAWFFANADTGVTVDAAFSERTYTAKDGGEKTAYEATVYEQFNDRAMPGDFDAQFARALKASNVKLGKAARGAARLPMTGGARGAGAGGAVGGVKPPDAGAPGTGQAQGGAQGQGGTGVPPPPPDAEKKKLDYQSVFPIYVETHPDDPKGERFWEAVRCASGRDTADWREFTQGDWQKCVDAFRLPF